MRIEWLQAVTKLRQGEVIALPTETVYGLAASLFSSDAINTVFRLKKRPFDNPLIVHVAKTADVACYVKMLPQGFEQLTEAFWPGPLTLVVPVDVLHISEQVRAGLSTAAFRVPAHPLTLQILSQTGPLVMPSANISGRPSATSYTHVEEDFGIDFPVVDGGESKKGLESTILVFWGEEGDGIWEVGRLGAISQEALAEVLGYLPVLRKSKEEVPICPGQKYRHYAPKARLILEENKDPHICVVGFSDRIYPKGAKVFSLGASDSADEAAHNLYRILRQLDEEGVEEAWVDLSFPEEGLWKSVRERLFKAASS